MQTTLSAAANVDEAFELLDLINEELGSDAISRLSFSPGICQRIQECVARHRRDQDGVS